MSLPNQLTVLRMILTPVFVTTLFIQKTLFNYLSLVVFFLASLTDWYDGYIARRFGYVTKWGKFLDPLADKMLITSAFVSFVIMGYVQAWMVVIIVARDFLITGLRFYAMAKGQPMTTNNLAKWKTFCQMMAIYVLLFYIGLVRSVRSSGVEGSGSQTALLNAIHRLNILDNLMLFVTIFTAMSGIVYLVENRGHLKTLALDFYRVFVPGDW